MTALDHRSLGWLRYLHRKATTKDNWDRRGQPGGRSIHVCWMNSSPDIPVGGLHRYVSGDDKWNKPFDMIRDGNNTFTWSHSKIAEYLAGQ